MRDPATYRGARRNFVRANRQIKIWRDLGRFVLRDTGVNIHASLGRQLQAPKAEKPAQP